MPAREGCPTPGKKAYGSLEAAWADARYLAGKPKAVRPDALNAYRCVCGACHVGRRDQQHLLDSKIKNALRTSRTPKRSATNRKGRRR